MNVLLIIQARMASARLPGKTLMKLDNIPLIQHTITRAKRAKNVDKVILATSEKKENDLLEKACQRIGVECFRGSEDDVLKRVVDAAKKYNPKFIVRICGDEPLLDIRILEDAIKKHIDEKAEYTTTVNMVPRGLDVEVINYDVLQKIEKETTENLFREHVTTYILRNPNKFKILRTDFGKKIARPDIVLTVDTKDDFDFVEKIYYGLKTTKKLYSDRMAEKVIEIIDSGKVKRKPIILLRADGSEKKGMGDVITLMKIAEKMNDKYEFIFACRNYSEAIDFIKNKRFEVFALPLDLSIDDEIRRIKSLCKERYIKYCIVELVPNDEKYVKLLSEFLGTMMIDFFGDIKVYSDILLNWDLFTDGLKYKFVGNTKKLLGPSNVPIDEKVRKLRKISWNKNIKNITVTFGGSDPNGLCFLVLKSVKDIENRYAFKFIIGPAFKDMEKFKKEISKRKIEYAISPSNIYEIFSKSDLVISNGGVTCFELCALGVPFIGISNMEWEIKRLRKLHELKACKHIIINNDLKKNILQNVEHLGTKHSRESMSKKQTHLVDGKGLNRIVNAIKDSWE